MNYLNIGIAATMCFLIACNSQSGQEEKVITERVQVFKSPEVVTTATLSKEIFYSEIYSNGKAACIQKEDVRMLLSEPLLEVLVVNGQLVNAGQVIARQDASALQRKLQRAVEALQQAEIALDDRLIDYGYRLADSNRIPVDIFKMAKIKSNYNTARLDEADVRRELLKTHILAPFSGKIMSLIIKAGSYGQAMQTLCSVINDKSMEIGFPVLESEYSRISIGMPVIVSPLDYPEHQYAGKITAINPQVDAHGMIAVTGVVLNSGGGLLDGMNVRVTARASRGLRLQVPISAVVERQGKPVVFTLENGHAKWNYVTLADRNDKQVIVEQGLKEGQKIITSHVATMAHNAAVSEGVRK